MSDSPDDPSNEAPVMNEAPGAALAASAPDDADGRAPNTAEARHSEGVRRERVVASKQYRDGTFHNTTGVAESFRPAAVDGQRKGTGWMLREWMFGGQERRPKVVLPLERPHEAWTKPIATGQRVTWLGHSTVLLELDGPPCHGSARATSSRTRRVLTDPVFANRIGPTPALVGPRRFHPVPAQLAELPKLDVILLSHDHFDHLCAPTMREIARLDVPIVTALGVGAYLERFGVAPSRITELDWHESATVGGIRFTATPCQHFSGRSLRSRNKTLWASWVIESERHKVFFSGDTGLTNEYVDTGRKYGPFDLVMLEIGAFHPSWGTIHLGPENALAAFDMLGGGTLLPVHWGTFSLGFHAWNEPGEELIALLAKAKPSIARPTSRVLTPRLGQVFEPDHVEGPTPWWRDLVPAREREALIASASATK
jgi:L-ascorbate metabolism protein UlaG (beta-lactamase superfamily)